MDEDMKLMKQGAEAKLYICNYLGKPTIVKERFQKNYRHSALDASITKDRLKNEAKSIVRCKTADVRTPALYLVDFERKRIYMQYFEHSITVKDFIIDIFTLQKGSGEKNSLNAIATKIGQTVRKLHECNIIHGDLTTSNMLLVKKNNQPVKTNLDWLQVENVDLIMIDFGLSHVDASPEHKGVDLYVLERAIISTHNDYPELFGKILEAYESFKRRNIREIIRKFEEVRARGRKRTMVG